MPRSRAILHSACYEIENENASFSEVCVCVYVRCAFHIPFFFASEPQWDQLVTIGCRTEFSGMTIRSSVPSQSVGLVQSGKEMVFRGSQLLLGSCMQLRPSIQLCIRTKLPS